jgi:hypothetical protein
MSSNALFSTFACIGLSLAGLALFASTQPPHAARPAGGEWPELSKLTPASLASEVESLRQQLRQTDAAAATAVREAKDLKAALAQAAEAVAQIPVELETLGQQLTTIEGALRQAVAEREAASQDLADYSQRFCDFQKLSPGYEEVRRAERVLGGKRLTTREEAYWRERPELKNSAFAYAKKHREFLINKQKLANDAALAAEHCQAIEGKLATVRWQQTDAPNRLMQARQDLAELPTKIAAVEAELTQQTTARGALQQRLVAAETVKARLDANVLAAKKRAAAQDRLAAELAAKQEQRQRSSSALVFAPAMPAGPSAQPRGLDRLPRGVRNLFLAKIAGIDLGIDAPDVGAYVPDIDLYVPEVNVQVPEVHTYEPNAGLLRPPLADQGPRIHADGRGQTTVNGNRTFVQRSDGPSSLYTRDGQWEWHQMSHGVRGVRYYDDFRGVTQFDYVNPHSGVRIQGEEPYYGNDYGQGWSVQMPAW